MKSDPPYDEQWDAFYLGMRKKEKVFYSITPNDGTKLFIVYANSGCRVRDYWMYRTPFDALVYGRLWIESKDKEPEAWMLHPETGRMKFWSGGAWEVVS